MNRKPVTSSMSAQVVAAATALGMTAVVLLGVDALSQQRSVSPYAQVVQLERVVVTGQRLGPVASTAASTVTTADARRGKADHCNVPAREAAASTTC